MTQYNRVNAKLSTFQLNKLKSAIKNENDVVIRLSRNMIVTLMIKVIFHMNYYYKQTSF